MSNTFAHLEDPQAAFPPNAYRNSPEFQPPPEKVQAASPFKAALTKFREESVGRAVPRSQREYTENAIRCALRAEREYRYRGSKDQTGKNFILHADDFLTFARDYEGALTVEVLQLKFGYSRATAYRRLQIARELLGANPSLGADT